MFAAAPPLLVFRLRLRGGAGGPDIGISAPLLLLLPALEFDETGGAAEVLGWLGSPPVMTDSGGMDGLPEADGFELEDGLELLLNDDEGWD